MSERMAGAGGTLCLIRRRGARGSAGSRPVVRGDGSPTGTSCCGLSLVELIVALAILTVGLAGTLVLYNFGLDKMRAVSESAIAMRAVQNEIETLRALPFHELHVVENGPFASETPELDVLVEARPSVTISEFAGNGRLKQVTARMVWIGDNGRTIEKKLTTLIADKGSGTTRHG